MKNLFYFSHKHLKFVEIKNIKLKFISMFVFFTVVSFILLTGALYIYSVAFNPTFNMPFVKNEKEMLKRKLKEVTVKYHNLGVKLDSIVSMNQTLRAAVNLPPISEEERKLGTGGSSKNNIFDIIKYKNNNDLIKTLEIVDDIERKVNFELSNYKTIKGKYENNKTLFACIPAIKPCSGELTMSGFGMRFHPILRQVRMHNGIDIVTDIGTPVHSTGDGTVEFVGTRGGYGLAVEIDHGFGYKTLYAHLSAVKVQVGDKVKRSTLIAMTGNSGLSSGPHLHYEVVYNGEFQDPEQFFFSDLDILKPKN